MCNEFLAALDQNNLQKNNVKLSVDIHIPDRLSGDADKFTKVLTKLTRHLATANVDAVINIELALHAHTHEVVTLYTHIAVNGEIIKSEQQRLEHLLRESDIYITSKINDDQLKFGFLYSFDSTELGNKKVPLPFNGKRVLLAEDNEINAMVFSSILEEWGCDCVVAINGADTIAFANALPFDIILMDIHMPVFSGIEATKKIRTFNPTIPIIALLASSRKADIQKIKDAGADNYLIKPATSGSIFLVLSKYLT